MGESKIGQPKLVVRLVFLGMNNKRLINIRTELGISGNLTVKFRLIVIHFTPQFTILSHPELVLLGGGKAQQIDG